MLTDKQRKKIIADYIQCGNYSQVARKHGISVTYVKKLVVKDKDSVNRFKQKKEENTRDILQYLDSRKIKIQGILDTILESITKEDIKNAPLQSRTTVFGTLIDKAILPYTNKITKVDDEHYEENKQTLKDELIKNLVKDDDEV